MNQSLKAAIDQVAEIDNEIKTLKKARAHVIFRGARAAHNDGMKVSDIARALGYDRADLAKYLTKNGLESVSGRQSRRGA